MPIKGIRDLRQMQIAFQKDGGNPDCGTPATPSARLVGMCGMKKTVNRVFPAEATGLMSSHIISRYYDPFLLAEVPIETGEEGLTFEQLPWFLAMGVAKGKSGVGVGNAKTWTFCPDLADGDMPDVATIRYGDNAAVWESSCCFARQLVISSSFQSAWDMKADIIGRDALNNYYYYGSYYDQYFETVAYPTPLHTILGQMTSFYVDSTCEFAATPTQRVGYLIDWTLTIPAFHPKFFQDGVLYYTTMGLASRALMLEATLEFDDDFTKKVLWDGWTDGTPFYMRIEALGDEIAGGGRHTARIDLVLEFDTFDPLDERDGNDIVKFNARTVYDVACDVPEWCIYVINTGAALPV